MPFVAFDLEIAQPVRDNDPDWLRTCPPIACAAIVREGQQQPIVAFHPQQRPEFFDPVTKGLNKRGCQALVALLNDAVRDGFTILTWNGLKFDFAIVAHESGAHAECVELALASVDMMFQVFCEKGHVLSLETALAGMWLAGKTHSVRLNDGCPAPIDGAHAPAMWQAGEYDAVIQYCCDDATQTLALGIECQRRRALRWISRRGKPMELQIGRRWLDVRQCLSLPLPDTSWMSEPMPRERFYAWMSPEAAV